MYPRYLQSWVSSLPSRLANRVCLNHPTDLRPDRSSTISSSFGPFFWVPLLFISRIILSTLRMVLARCLSLWFLLQMMISSRFFVRLIYAFFFLSSPLFKQFPVPIFPNIFVYIFSKSSDFFFVRHFYSCRCYSVHTFHYKHCTFFMLNSIPISWLYIFLVSISVSNSF